MLSWQNLWALNITRGWSMVGTRGLSQVDGVSVSTLHRLCVLPCRMHMQEKVSTSFKYLWQTKEQIQRPIFASDVLWLSFHWDDHLQTTSYKTPPKTEIFLRALFIAGLTARAPKIIFSKLSYWNSVTCCKFTCTTQKNEDTPQSSLSNGNWYKSL